MPEPEDASRAAALELGRSALRGSAWTLLGHAAGQGLRLATNLALTRLLFPAVFGQLALVQTFVFGLGMFSDIGTAPAIVQSRHGDDPRFLRTVWSMACVRGFFLWTGTWAIAHPVAAFYEQPLLAWLLPAAGFAAVLQGFESTALHTLRRHLRLGRLTGVDLIGQAAGMVAILLFVLAWRRIHGPEHPGAAWALVGGNLVASAIRLVLSHAALPGIRHSFEWDSRFVRDQLSFGRWVFGSTALTFLAGQLDRLLFGRTIPIETLGIYGIASMAAALPAETVLKLGTAVVFPTFARVAGRDDFARIFWNVRLAFLGGGAVLVTGLVATGPYLVRLLYDDRYAGAGWIVQILAVSAWFQVLGATNESAMLALGRPQWLAAGNLAKVVTLLLLVPLGFRLGGFPGAVLGLAGSEAARYVVSAASAARRGLRGIGRDAAVSALIAASAGAGLLAGRAGEATAHPDLGGFLAAGCVVSAIWASLGILGWRRGGAAAVAVLRRRPG